MLHLHDHTSLKPIFTTMTASRSPRTSTRPLVNHHLSMMAQLLPSSLSLALIDTIKSYLTVQLDRCAFGARWHRRIACYNGLQSFSFGTVNLPSRFSAAKYIVTSTIRGTSHLRFGVREGKTSAHGPSPRNFLPCFAITHHISRLESTSILYHASCVAS